MRRSGASRSASGVSRAWSATRPSTSRSRSRLEVPGSLPTTRAMSGDRLGLQAAADLEDFFGVEHFVVRLEEGAQGLLVDLHLGRADAERAPALHAVVVG